MRNLKKRYINVSRIFKLYSIIQCIPFFRTTHHVDYFVENIHIHFSIDKIAHYSHIILQVKLLMENL